MKQINQTITNKVFNGDLPWHDGELSSYIDGILIDGGGWAGGWFIGIADHAVHHGLYSWYIEKDLAAAKQWFYVAAKSIAISASKSIGNEKFWALHPFMFPLLSDNTEMIATYSTIETPNLLERRGGLRNNEFDIHLVQMALQGNDAKVASMLESYKAKGYKKQESCKVALIQFMEGLLNSDTSQMEAAITLDSHWKLSNPTTEDFLSDYAVVLCKLAWLRGYEVQVDSPLVPMAFMPVAPLANYDDVYEFLKPGWQAPPQPAPEPEKKGMLSRLLGK